MLETVPTYEISDCWPHSERALGIGPRPILYAASNHNAI